MAEGYSFPKRNIEELIEFFDVTYKLKLTPATFKTPKAEEIQKLYALLLEDMKMTSLDDLNQNFFSENLEYPELHKQALLPKYLFMALQDVMELCGITMFKFRDLVEPTPKRTIVNLSGLINIHCFFMLKFPVYENCAKEWELAKEKNNCIIKENEELQRKVNILKSELAEQEPECQLLKQEIGELKSTIAEQQAEKSEQYKEHKTSENIISELTASFEHKEAICRRFRDKCAKLSDQIVQSPDRMKHEQEQMMARVVQLNDQKKAESLVNSEIQTRFQEKEKWLAESRPVMEKWQDCLNRMAGISTMTQSINSNLEKKQKGEYTIKDIAIKIDQVKENKEILHDKMAKLRLQTQIRKEDIKTRKEQLEVDLQFSAKTKQEDIEIDQQLDVEHSKYANEIQNHERKIKMFHEGYAEVMKSIDSYHTQIAEEFEKIHKLKCWAD